MTQPVDDQHVSTKVSNNSRLTAILSGILAIIILAIAIESYYQISRLTDPERLGDRIETAIRDNYPEVHEELVAQVKARAPELAKEVSKDLIQSTPEVRAELEQFAARQLETGLDEITELSAEEFRDLLNRNRETVTAAFEQIEQAPEEARRLILETEADMEQALGVDLQRQMQNAVKMHRQLNDKLDRLNDPDETLDAKSLLERRLIRILRTMEMQYDDEMTAAT